MINLRNKEDCCGCTACIDICPQQCISMELDEEGFRYPRVNELECIECSCCEQVCPILNKKSRYSNHENLSKEDYVKKICESIESKPNIYVAFNMEKEVRDESTSGGIFSALADYVFEKSGWVFGVVLDQDNNVVHFGTPNKEELYRFRGSKYVQSEHEKIYLKVKELLDKHIWVLYSGTPCQVEGLYKFLGKNYECLITVDIFCHGVGSPWYWDIYTKYMEKQYHSKIKKIKFREKTYGYNSACMAVYFENGTKSRRGHDDDLYWTAFSKCFIFRPSCYACHFKEIVHPSDFTIGDFWDVRKLPKDFRNANGCTLLIAQSNKAEEILSEIKSNISILSVNMEEALIINGGHMESKLISSSPLPKHRTEFFDTVNKYGLKFAVNKYMPLSCMQRIKCMTKPILYHIGLLEFFKKLCK